MGRFFIALSIFFHLRYNKTKSGSTGRKSPQCMLRAFSFLYRTAAPHRSGHGGGGEARYSPARRPDEIKKEPRHSARLRIIKKRPVKRAQKGYGKIGDIRAT